MRSYIRWRRDRPYPLDQDNWELKYFLWREERPSSADHVAAVVIVASLVGLAWLLEVLFL